METAQGHHVPAKVPHVVFLPDWSRFNPYLRLLKDGVEAQGFSVTIRNFPRSIFALNRALGHDRTAQILHLHWINDLIGPIFWSPNLAVARLKLWLICVDVLVARLRGRKVIWTIHNLVSHESPNPALEIQARRLLAKSCSQVVLHSASALRQVEETLGFSLSHKACVIPHGHYLAQYPHSPEKCTAFRKKWNLSDDHLVLLLFGELRRYKGVSTLLQAFSSVDRPDLRLIIAGRSNDESLTREIKEAEEADERIKSEIGFVPDADVAPLYTISDLAIVPFERTLTSGSVILAMSMGKALLLPDHARIIDIATQDGTIFFDDTQDLARKLCGLKKPSLSEMGRHNAVLSQSFDWKSIGNLLSAVYR